MKFKVCKICGVTYERTYDNFLNKGSGCYSSMCKVCYNSTKKVSKHERRAEGSKVCSKCKEEKPVSEFYSNSCNKDGLDYWCVDCKAGALRPVFLKKVKFCKRCGTLDGVTRNLCGKCRDAVRYENKVIRYYNNNYKDNNKLCNRCLEYKDVKLFKKGKGLDKLNHICCECLDKGSGEYSSRYSKLNGRALGDIISKEKFIEWYNSNHSCYYCGISEDEWEIIRNNIKLKGTDNDKKCIKVCGDTDYLTIDRVDNNKGYIEGNIVKACPLCNHVKGSLFNKEDMLIISKIIRDKVNKYL